MSEIEGIPSRRKITASIFREFLQNIFYIILQEIRQRNERESEILIGNLGTQKHIEKAELVTDIGDVRALAALHESLRWFAIEVK
uniref:Four helix bundle protein n=1 Tax=Heterorhabditis bacteriophora TaxID=37862 RepID=A0A1I7WFV8_HETBA